MNAAERIYLEHNQNRDDVHKQAKRTANRIIDRLTEVRTPSTFVTMGFAELKLLLDKLAEQHAQYLQEDRACNEFSRDAMGL